jgi:hypothetical protein
MPIAFAAETTCQLTVRPAPPFQALTLPLCRLVEHGACHEGVQQPPDTRCHVRRRAMRLCDGLRTRVMAAGEASNAAGGRHGGCGRAPAAQLPQRRPQSEACGKHALY